MKIYILGGGRAWSSVGVRGGLWSWLAICWTPVIDLIRRNYGTYSQKVISCHFFSYYSTSLPFFRYFIKLALPVTVLQKLTVLQKGAYQGSWPYP
jgi:hypothetical protein